MPFTDFKTLSIEKIFFDQILFSVKKEYIWIYIIYLGKHHCLSIWQLCDLEDFVCYSKIASS